MHNTTATNTATTATPPDDDPQAPDDAQATLRDTFVQILRRKVGLNDPFAQSMAIAILEGLQEWYPAENLYIPARSKRERNQAIRKAFTGRNHDEVMRQFGISRATLYTVLAAERG